MNKANSKVDAILHKAGQWQEELKELRRIVLECDLSEEVKWGQPCFTDQGRNVVLIHGFKEYCALLFFKGVLLNDPRGILIQQTENVQAGRQIRFTNVKQIRKLEPVLKAYIRQAVEVEKAGSKIEKKKHSEFKAPAELLRKFDEVPNLKAAFHALTPGRQRAYILYFSGAKQSKTRESRIEKCMLRILSGKGLND